MRSLDGVQELDRRDVIRGIGIAALIPLLSGGSMAQQADAINLDDVAFITELDENQPDPDGPFFEDKTRGRWIFFASDTGAIYDFSLGDSEWTEIPTHLPGFATGDLPSDPKNGTLYFDQDRNLPTWWDTDHYEYPNFVDDVLTTAVTKSNFSAKNEYWSFDINPGSLIKGRTYQLDLMGIFSTANTSDQFTVIIDLGGDEIATLQNDAANATDAPWSMETTWTVREHGTTGKIAPHSRGLFDSQSKDDHHPETTIDTTVAETLKISVQWDTADVDNIVTLGQGHLEQKS